jgi:phage FluMu protein Com
MTDGNVTIRPVLHDFRCVSCGRLLFRAYLAPGSKVEIKCWHQSCHAFNEFPRRDVYTQVGNVISIVRDTENNRGELMKARELTLHTE